MSDIFSSGDVTFMDTVLAQVGSWTERSGIVYTAGTMTYNGTAGEAGDPPAVTMGTRSVSVRKQKVDLRQVERSAGKFYQNDQTLSVRGSFTHDDLIGVDSGTYRPIDGPYKYFMGSDLFYQCVAREVQ